MNKALLTLIAIITCTTLFAQSPNYFSYQAVVRDNSGNVITNQEVSFKISILQNSATGTSLYTEEHKSMTNNYGLINLEIGNGTTSNDFAAIDWSEGPYFTQIEMDHNGGTNYSLMGTSQLLSVPYALFAQNVKENTYTEGFNAELGGYVFYVTPDGKHGLVAETIDQSTGSDWYNAFNIISDPNNLSERAKNFTDWRMPTKYELDLMYTKKDLIPGLANESYWSSTYYFGDIAYSLDFRIGSSSKPAKYNSYRIRAIRSF